MKRIGLLTIHNAYNYGAVLQAYATETIIEKAGYECEIIDYDTTTFLDDRKTFFAPNSLYNIVQDLRSLLHYKNTTMRKNNFDSFMKQNYRLSEKKYFNDFNFDCEKYDCVVTGSDQTFCLHLRNNPKEMRAFFLPGVKGKRKISYASSMGEKFSKITGEEKSFMKEALNDFSSLAVRENKSAEYIKDLTGRLPEVALDPTLLIEAEDWEKIAKPTKYDNDEYILFYTVLSDKWVVDYVKELSQKTGLKVVAPHPTNRFEVSSNFERAEYCGPAEFISLIKNAKFVVTTSFHATTFSVIFNKPFRSLLLSEGNRISSLLSLLNLENRIVKEKDEKIYSIEKESHIDNHLLEIEKQKSIEYLKNALEGEKNL